MRLLIVVIATLLATSAAAQTQPPYVIDINTGSERVTAILANALTMTSLYELASGKQAALDGVIGFPGFLEPALVRQARSNNEFERRDAMTKVRERLKAITEAIKPVQYVWIEASAAGHGTPLYFRIGEYNFDKQLFPLEIDGVKENRGGVPVPVYCDGRAVAATDGPLKSGLFCLRLSNIKAVGDLGINETAARALKSALNTSRIGFLAKRQPGFTSLDMHMMSQYGGLSDVKVESMFATNTTTREIAAVRYTGMLDKDVPPVPGEIASKAKQVAPTKTVPETKPRATGPLILDVRK